MRIGADCGENATGFTISLCDSEQPLSVTVILSANELFEDCAEFDQHVSMRFYSISLAIGIDSWNLTAVCRLE